MKLLPNGDRVGPAASSAAWPVSASKPSLATQSAAERRLLGNFTRPRLSGPVDSLAR